MSRKKIKYVIKKFKTLSSGVSDEGSFHHLTKIYFFVNMPKGIKITCL